MSPNILVVGTGSIGKRHVDNLLRLGAQVTVFRYRPTGHASDLPQGVTIVPELDRALAAPGDAVVIANRSDQHLAVAAAAAEHGKALFIEKPVATSLDGVDALLSRVAARKLVVEVGFMLRSHPNLLWIRELLHGGGLGEVHYARAAVGQLLSEWRPGSDHRAGYGAKRDTGGGVIFDLIHEIDLIAWLLGDVAEVSAMTSYVDALEIETEAIAQIGLRLRNGVLAQVQLDYVRPTYERTLQIVGSRASLKWDYVAGSVTIAERGKPEHTGHCVPTGFERNDMFLAHMQHFLKRVTASAAPIAPIEDGVSALRVALACHRSAETGRLVTPGEIDATYRVTGRRA